MDQGQSRSRDEGVEGLSVCGVAPVPLAEADLEVFAGQRLLVASGQDYLLGVVGDACKNQPGANFMSQKFRVKFLVAEFLRTLMDSYLHFLAEHVFTLKF